jgi:hypothetical protein
VCREFLFWSCTQETEEARGNGTTLSDWTLHERYYQGDQSGENEVSGTCSTHESVVKLIQIPVPKKLEGLHLVHPGLDDRMILKRTL